MTDGQGWPLVGEDDIVSKEGMVELAQTPLVRHARVLVRQNNSMMCPVIPSCMLFFSLALLKFFGAFCFLLGLLTLTLALERTKTAFFLSILPFTY